jgi:hypothetical protein
VYEAAGATVRGLEGLGDHAITLEVPVNLGLVAVRTLHSEVKRYHERAKFPEWWQQTIAEAPPGTIPALHTRADHGEWLVTLRLSDFVAVLR